MTGKSPFILPAILVSMVCCISLWFAGNAVIGDLQTALALSTAHIGLVTSGVHAGFIGGTLLFSYLAISDRISARLVYFVCAVLGALFNILMPAAPGPAMLVALRVLTGVMLAGIYPVGMKIAFSWYPGDIGKILGYLLGAFTIGTALPHLLKTAGALPDYRLTLTAVSLLAVAGGAIMLLFVPLGPHLPVRSKLIGGAISRIFKNQNIRPAALSYFGHMWELYAFWAFVPLYMIAFSRSKNLGFDIHLWSFLIIAAGSLGCIVGGLYAARFGSVRVACSHLAVSGLCCLMSPLLINETVPPVFFLLYLIIWGITVVGDSPQFSALIARKAEPELVGSTLTFVNCIGFFISIISIELISGMHRIIGMQYIFLLLAPGPIFGLAALWRPAFKTV